MPSKFSGRLAKPCRAHPAGTHYVNRVGGISCEACVPPSTSPETRLIADFGVWVECDTCGLLVESSDHQYKAGESLAVSEKTAGNSHERSPGSLLSEIDRPNPTLPPTAQVLVSLRLDWFLAAPTSQWADPSITSFDILTPLHRANQTIPSGFYQRLTTDLFAWLVAQVNRIASTELNDDGIAEAQDSWRRLQEIANAAVECGVLGEWALDVAAWPIEVPDGFVPDMPPRVSWALSVDRAWQRRAV